MVMRRGGKEEKNNNKPLVTVHEEGSEERIKVGNTVPRCFSIWVSCRCNEIPDSLLENRMMVGLDSSELVKATERFLHQPTKTEAKDAKEVTRLRSMQEMCSEFLRTDEQLQHMEEKMVMEVEQ